MAVGGKIERDITVEYLREQPGKVLRRYVPTASLPTSVTEGDMSGDEHSVGHLARENDLADGAER